MALEVGRLDPDWLVMPKLDRRIFLAQSSLACTLGVPLADLRGRPAIGELLRGLFPEFEAPQAVGRLYLKDRPEERTGTLALLRRLQAQPLTCPDDLRRVLARIRSEEFARGDTVVLDGWVLARSEARICALAALL